ncbi:MAG: transporter substrate-binding domain-containing protein [Acutalibacteraceae bacterium]|nr:transporter substrate-binding domain-containing protein [Acutalibacteraceae bacterium]
MKRIISVIICAVIILTLTGCDSGDYKKAVEFFESGEYQQALEIFSDLEGYKDTDTYIEKINTKIKEKKYNDAISYIKSKDYVKAIELLEEIPDYNDSKDLVGKVHYVYGSQLFNEKDFIGAYSHFQEATGFSDIDKRKSMVDYFGGVYLTNNSEHVAALSYFERALSSEYKSEAAKHFEEISKNILYGVWIGDFTNNNGVKLEAHINYTNNGKFNVSYVDRSNGYKVVTDFAGNLVVGAENSVFVSGINFYKIKFDISSTNRMRITYVDNSKLSEMLVNSYEKTAEWTPSYKVDNITYPTMKIPDLFLDDLDDSKNNSSEHISSNKKLIIAISPDYEPFEYEANGEIVGFDIDLINLIADGIGYNIEYKECEFDSIIMCVAEGEADLGISAISINDTRLQSVDFTDVYVTETIEHEGEEYFASYAIAVQKGSELINDLNAQIKKLKDNGKIQELISKYNID